MSTDNPNTIPKILGRFILYISVISALPVLAFIVNPYSHLVAQILTGVWFFVFILGTLFMQRAPCYYNSYREWYADRANWFKRF